MNRLILVIAAVAAMATVAEARNGRSDLMQLHPEWFDNDGNMIVTDTRPLLLDDRRIVFVAGAPVVIYEDYEEGNDPGENDARGRRGNRG
jgi:hypothetical protein